MLSGEAVAKISVSSHVKTACTTLPLNTRWLKIAKHEALQVRLYREI